MKKLSLVLAVSFGVLIACNKEKTVTDDSKDIAIENNEDKFESDKAEDAAEFAVKAADGGMMEVELGKIAATNASNPAVKEFGNMMVSDHSKAGEELKALAASKNITLPAALSEDKVKKVEEFRAKKGAEFDKEYMDFMVEDHKEDIEKFSKAAEKLADPEIKNWAAGKVPTLQQHLKHAEEVYNSVK